MEKKYIGPLLKLLSKELKAFRFNFTCIIDSFNGNHFQDNFMAKHRIQANSYFKYINVFNRIMAFLSYDNVTCFIYSEHVK